MSSTHCSQREYRGNTVKAKGKNRCYQGDGGRGERNESLGDCGSHEADGLWPMWRERAEARDALDGIESRNDSSHLDRQCVKGVKNAEQCKTHFIVSQEAREGKCGTLTTR